MKKKESKICKMDSRLKTKFIQMPLLKDFLLLVGGKSFSFKIFNWLDVTHLHYGGESVLLKGFLFKCSSHPKTPQQEHPESLAKYTTQ